MLRIKKIKCYHIHFCTNYQFLIIVYPKNKNKNDKIWLVKIIILKMNQFQFFLLYHELVNSLIFELKLSYCWTKQYFSRIGVSRYLPGISHYIPDISRYIPSIIWYFEPCTYFQLSCNSRVMFAIQRYIGVLSSRKHKILQGIKFYIKPLSISSYIHVSTLI